MNGYYQEWNLLSLGFLIVTTALTFIFIISRIKKNEIDEALLKTQSKLSHDFESMIINESIKIFQTIDDHIPIALSRKDNPPNEQSMFDRFCVALVEFQSSDNNSDRILFKEILVRALSGIISKEVNRFLSILNRNDRSQDTNPTRIRFEFEGETERNLSKIAINYVKVKRQYKIFHLSRKIALWSLPLSILAIFVFSPSVFINSKIVYNIGKYSLCFAGIFIALGIISFVTLSISKIGIEDGVE